MASAERSAQCRGLLVAASSSRRSAGTPRQLAPRKARVAVIDQRRGSRHRAGRPARAALGHDQDPVFATGGEGRALGHPPAAGGAERRIRSLREAAGFGQQTRGSKNRAGTPSAAASARTAGSSRFTSIETTAATAPASSPASANTDLVKLRFRRRGSRARSRSRARGPAGSVAAGARSLAARPRRKPLTARSIC